MNKKLIAPLFALALLAAPCAAQDKAAGANDLQALRAAVKADKRAFVAATLQLTDAQAKKFWPAYDAYQRSLNGANRRRALVVEQLVTMDKPPTDLYARQLAAELVAADEAEVKARRTLYTRVMRALPATTAARYLQVEAKIRAMQDYDLAVAIPLIK